MALGLKSPRQEWSTVLGPIADAEVKTTGHDLTLVVVYGSGPAKGLGRYFSNIRGGQLPQSTGLDPGNRQQVAAYKHALQTVAPFCAARVAAALRSPCADRFCRPAARQASRKRFPKDSLVSG
jgi:hypothetical protein